MGQHSWKRASSCERSFAEADICALSAHHRGILAIAISLAGTRSLDMTRLPVQCARAATR